jgi:anaerobic selenocysteine-containing dehydrogenase
MLGANPVASNGSLMTAPDVTARLKALTQRGKLVVIDPRRTETAQTANAHHFIRPGSDAWFLIALVNALVRQGMRRIEAYGGTLNGLDAALTAVAALEPGADLWSRTGIHAVTVDEIARDLSRATRAIVYGRMGLSTQGFGSVCQWLIQLINILTGNLDRVGGVLPNQAAWSINGAGTSPGAYGRWTSRVRGLPEVSGELPAACLAEEIVTPGAGQIKALLVSAGNPVLSTPGGAALERALPGLDFMVAIDPYINETTRFAHLILPPASALTQVGYDVFFNAFAIRRVARVNLPVVAPSPEELADWQIVDRLGREYAAAAGKPWRDLPTPEAFIEAQLAAGGSGLTYEQLVSAPHGIDLGPLAPNLIERLVRDGRAIECAPPLLMADLQRLASASQTPGAPLTLIGRRHLRSNNSWMHHSHRLTKGPTRHELWMHPDDLAAHGLVDGAQVRVTSAAGDIVTAVRAHADLMPGVASLPHGFGHQREGVRTKAKLVAGASYNDLSPVDVLDVPSGTAAVNGFEIRVNAA